jgi:hypothetical protein
VRQKDAPRFGARNSAFIAQHGDDPFGAPRFTALEADCATRRFYSAAATPAPPRSSHNLATVFSACSGTKQTARQAAFTDIRSRPTSATARAARMRNCALICSGVGSAALQLGGE